MKQNLIAAAAFAVALALPLGVCAQQTQYPTQTQNPGQTQSGRATMPSQAKLEHRWTKRLGSLNLSGEQQQHIQTLIQQYSQAHPEGSPRDPSSNKELRRQIMGVLTSDQQNQLRQERKARHQQKQQRGSQQGNQNQGPSEQSPQGAPPDQQQPPPGQQPPAAPPA